MLETLNDWRNVIQWVFTGLVAWIWWSIKTRFTTKEDHLSLEKRVAAAEVALSNLPTLHDHHLLVLQGAETKGHVRRVEETVQRVQTQLDRIEEFLIKGAGR